MKRFLTKFYQNHVLSTLLVLLILALGTWAYTQMPKEKSPNVSFHWVVIQTTYPGANAQQVEQDITYPIERFLKNYADIGYTLSTSREHISDILVRFEEISESKYQNHISQLKADLQSFYVQAPKTVKQPDLIEINSANTFPSATLVFTTDKVDDDFQYAAQRLEDKLRALPQVYKVSRLGQYNKIKDLAIRQDMLHAYAIEPMMLQQHLESAYQLNVIGSLVNNSRRIPNQLMTPMNQGYPLEDILIPTAKGPVPLSSLVFIETSYQPGPLLAGQQGKTAYVFSIMKKPDAHVIALIDEVKQIIDTEQLKLAKNQSLQLIDDQSISTKQALAVMFNNAGIGLLLVLLTVGILIGVRLSLFMCLAMPVIFAATILFLYLLDQSINITVLLGLVVVLGMVVDDSIVILEAIAYQLKKGRSVLDSIMTGLSEVSMPVICTVLTTIATFLPLMLLPGILGQFMFVLPLVVSAALVFSLLEGLLLMPAHIHALSRYPESRFTAIRNKITHKVINLYLRSLIAVIRHPSWIFGAILGLCLIIAGTIYQGKLKLDFFALEPSKVFYINLELPVGTHEQKTLNHMERIAKQVPEILGLSSFNQYAYYTGIQFGTAGVHYGSHLGQIFISLPEHSTHQVIVRIIEKLRQGLQAEDGIITYQVINDGPPLTDTIDIKLTGLDLEQLMDARNMLTQGLKDHPYIHLIESSANLIEQNNIQLNLEKIQNAKLDPKQVTYMLNLALHGITLHQDSEQALSLITRLRHEYFQTAEIFEQIEILNSTGARFKLSDLIIQNKETVPASIQHFNAKRMLELNFTYDAQFINALEASDIVQSKWQAVSAPYPHIEFQFHGLLDDILETLKLMPWIMLLSIGLVYFILGTQFNSFTQPLIIMITTPLAVLGVLFGLVISGYPISIYAIYGCIALIGIAVNAAILLLSASQDRVKQGFSKTKAMIFAAKRRFMPIMISVLTTIAGLSSLCFGWGGESLLWGPIAAAIVYGLGISTLLTLYCIPVLYLYRAKP